MFPFAPAPPPLRVGVYELAAPMLALAPPALVAAPDVPPPVVGTWRYVLGVLLPTVPPPYAESEALYVLGVLLPGVLVYAVSLGP